MTNKVSINNTCDIMIKMYNRIVYYLLEGEYLHAKHLTELLLQLLEAARWKLADYSHRTANLQLY